MRTSRPVLLALLAALAVALAAPPPATAQYFGRNKVQYENFDFREFDTDHFEIYFYEEERLAARDAGRMAERWYRRHTQTFLRQFDERKPLIFYANDADFQQTNVIRGRIGQGTGGVTESLKERVVMPFTGIYAENNHVLGHELVHSFQYDIGLRNRDQGFQLGRLPLWLVEGMAEYLSVGRLDPHTAMWLRDYALRDDLPTIEQLTESYRYFPYRFGQAYMAYIGGKYGDPAVTNLFKLAGRVGVDSAFVYALGITADSLSTEWQLAVSSTYLPLIEDRTRPEEYTNVVIGAPGELNQLNVSPVISPDGEYVAFISQRDLFNINLFIADAETGEIVQELQGTTSNPHFDAMRFINSAGTWSPAGRRFAFVTFVQGDNEIAIIDAGSGEIERRTRIEDVGAILNTAWSPDGQTIAFTGIDGGISDLYLLDLATNEVRQLTNDRYADLQPAWSPDGQTLAFATDRGPEGSNFETLDFSPMRIGLMDVGTREVRILRPFGQVEHYNPAFAPDGQSLYFISTHGGFKDIYRYALDEEQAYQVTNLATGVTGISNLSPALSVAAQSGRMVFSAFSNGGYSIFSMPDEEARAGEPAEPLSGIATAGVLPPVRAANEGLVSSYLRDPVAGLPGADYEVDAEPYDSKLRLDYVAPPSVGVGVSTGGLYGSQVGAAGGVGFFFSDMLGNRSLTVVAQANGTYKDIGGQVVYLNRKRRLNYGVGFAHIPLLSGGIGYVRVPTPSGDRLALGVFRNRIFNTQASLITSYPFSTTRRFDFSLGAVRYGFDREVELYALDAFGNPRRRLPEQNLPEPDALYFFQPSAAYVSDFSYFGFTSPVQGGRYRIGVSPRIGTFTYVQGLLDYRRYFFFDPVTVAVRGLHVGNYGAGGLYRENPGSINYEEANFTREYLNAPYYPGFVRGYSFDSFNRAVECGPPEAPPAGAPQGFNICNAENRLLGTRIALTSAEIRIPLLGTEQFGLIDFPYVPTEVGVFADAGLAWTRDEPPTFKFVTDDQTLRSSPERFPVVSAGFLARFNLLGAIVLDAYYAFPFQRVDSSGDWGLRIGIPGW